MLPLQVEFQQQNQLVQHGHHPEVWSSITRYNVAMECQAIRISLKTVGMRIQLHILHLASMCPLLGMNTPWLLQVLATSSVAQWILVLLRVSTNSHFIYDLQKHSKVSCWTNVDSIYKNCLLAENTSCFYFIISV